MMNNDGRRIWMNTTKNMRGRYVKNILKKKLFWSCLKRYEIKKNIRLRKC